MLGRETLEREKLKRKRPEEEQAVQKMVNSANDSKVRIIGINGVDTSGKTEFAKGLARYLKAIGISTDIVHMDDFHNPSDIRKQGSDEVDAYYRNAFNYTDVKEQLLQPVKQEGCLDRRIECLDLATDRYEKTVKYRVEPGGVLLVEGVLLFRPPLDEYFDYRIFLSISFEEELSRAEVRDVPLYGEQMLGKYQNKYIPIAKRYRKEWHPEEKSDMIIDNCNWNSPGIIR